MFPFRSRPRPLRLEPLEDRLLPAGLAAASPDAVSLTQLPQYSSPAPADPSADSEDDSDGGADDTATPESGYPPAAAVSPEPSTIPPPRAPAGGPPLPPNNTAGGPESGELPAVPNPAGGPDAATAYRGGPVPRDSDDRGPQRYDEPRVFGWAVPLAAPASLAANDREALARAELTREAVIHPHQLVLANAPPAPPPWFASPAPTPAPDLAHPNGSADRAEEQSAGPFDPAEIAPAPATPPEPSASERPGGTKPEVFVGLPLAGMLPLDFPALEVATREFLGRIADLGADLAEAPDRYLILAGALVAAGAAHAVWVGRGRERTVGQPPAKGRAPT